MTTSTAGLSFSYVYAPEVVALGATLPAVGILIVATRFCIRRSQKTSISADDWLILGALMMVIGMGTCLITGAKESVMGYPTPAPPSLSPAGMETYVEPSVKEIQQIEFAFQIMMLIAYALIKLSIIYFLRRLFVVGKTGMSGRFGIITNGLTVVIVSWLFAFLFLFIFNCGSAVGDHWGSLSTVSACHYSFTAEEGMASSDLILDIVIFFLPFPMIWNLNMTSSKKAAVSGIFIIGAAAIAASITRLVIYIQILTLGDKFAIDENLAITVSLYWSLIEAGLALLAACLPSLSPLFARRSLTSLINSVRSVLSLQSLRSQNTVRSQNNTNRQKQISRSGSYRVMADEQGTASHAHIVPKEDIGVDCFILGDVEKASDDTIREGEIHIHSMLTQERRGANV